MSTRHPGKTTPPDDARHPDEPNRPGDARRLGAMRQPGDARRLGDLAAATVALLGMLLFGALPLAGQSALEEVERLTRAGRTEEARVALAAWWDGDRAEASRGELQRGLWLRGRLTVDPVQAELDFQRLVVLYPSGEFTPDALLRMAQAAWALGDEARARSHVAALERDYPGSAATENARRWLADAGPVPPPGDTPSRSAGARAEPPTEMRPDRPAGEAGDAAMNYFVQLGAFAEPERAMALYDSVRDQGVDARVVRVEGSQFVHVRVGRFADRAAAVELLDELTEQGLNAALVRDDRPEEPLPPR